jgi:endonuclease/exonuclease/phosphatase (EEP) superfamily protein YafD
MGGVPSGAVGPIDHCLVSRTLGVQNNWMGPDVGSDPRPLIADLVVLSH